ncbi:MAG: outer membrane beta-barrel protein [Bdellovibrionia bacterium]
MQGFISIFNFKTPLIVEFFVKFLASICILFLLSIYPLINSTAYAQEAPPDPNAQAAPADPNAPQQGEAPQQGAPPPQGKSDKTEEEDYSNTPFTSYGEFNESEDEEADSKFFQYGRFFGVSLGLGAEFLDGNRGALWQGGFPMVDFKLHYWFDFQMALDMGFFTAQQFYDTTVKGLGHVDVNVVHVGVDVKYYFPTKNLSAALSFASPYLLAGVGSYSKTENSQAQSTQDPDTSLGVTLGLGLEFVLSPRKSYFELEAKGHYVVFKDTYTTNFQATGIQNLTGNFYTVSGSILFTW